MAASSFSSDHPLWELQKNFLQDSNPERWIGFHHSFNIEQVFPPLGGSPCRIGSGPDFTLKHILDHSDWQTRT